MNILYIDIDSLRPDHLGCYGYHRNTSPNIDALARDGLRFENIYVSDVPCHPSRTALWSGRHGLRTGLVGHGGTAGEPFIEGPERGFSGQFREDGWMTALRRVGYHTTTVSSFGERHGCWHWYAGFNEIYNPGLSGLERADQVAPIALDWLDRNAGRDGKWFLHVNMWDPHTPFRTPEAYGDPFSNEPLPDWLTPEVLARSVKGFGPHSALEPNGYGTEKNLEDNPRAPVPIDSMANMAAWVNGYDTGVRYADDYVGKFVEKLKQLGQFENTVIIVSADHGENIGELNVWSDHQTADKFTCNIPLIIRWPGKDGMHGVNSDLHYHFDWAATLIDLVGGKVPASWDGQSFAAALAAGTPDGRDFVVTSQGAWACQRGVRFRLEERDWMLLRTYHDGHKNLDDVMLFDLTNDPHEQRNVAVENPLVTGHALELLDRWRGDTTAKSRSDVDPLVTVIHEGGPYHCRGYLGDYLERLRHTGRAAHAETLAARHPNEI